MGGDYGANVWTRCSPAGKIVDAVKNACLCIHKALYAIENLWDSVVAQGYLSEPMQLLLDNRQLYHDMLQKEYDACKSKSTNICVVCHSSCWPGCWGAQGPKAYAGKGGCINLCPPAFDKNGDVQPQTIWHEFGRVYLWDELPDENTFTTTDVYVHDRIIEVLCRDYDQIRGRR